MPDDSDRPAATVERITLALVQVPQQEDRAAGDLGQCGESGEYLPDILIPVGVGAGRQVRHQHIDYDQACLGVIDQDAQLGNV